MAQPFLIADSICKSFPVGKDEVKILKNITFEIDPSSFNIIFGPSGSGKSTFLNVLVGLEPPSSGSVRFHDLDIYSLKPDELTLLRAHRFGLVFQHPYWVQSLSVLENVALPMIFLGFSESVSFQKAREELSTVGMQKYETMNPNSLSGGQQQKVSLARALLTNPWVIVADEPTGSLDSKSSSEVINLLLYLCKKVRRTIVMITHNIEYISLADKMLWIKDGQSSTREEAIPKPLKIEIPK